MTSRNRRGATLVFGGQAGSEGKGAIVGYLARRQKWGAAICTFMTNAGHTFQEGREKVVVQQLPVALVSQDVGLLLVAGGSAITLSQLEKELNLYDSTYRVSDRLVIDPRAMIIEPEDAEYEAKETKYLASTAKGCGRALARKVMRSKDVRLARDIPWLKPFIKDTSAIANTLLDSGSSLLIEGSQGFDLDINHGIEYPYCTSRGTTPMQTLADCGIAGSMVSDIIAVLRTYPIRVGNVIENGVEVGNSGPFGGRELTWEEITERSGSPVPLIERTTVTQRVRRIFEMDAARLGVMSRVCRPTELALTFADYVDYGVAGQNTDTYVTSPKLEKFINKVEFATMRAGRKPFVTLIKTGPNDSDMIDLSQGSF